MKPGNLCGTLLAPRTSFSRSGTSLSLLVRRAVFLLPTIALFVAGCGGGGSSTVPTRVANAPAAPNAATPIGGASYTRETSTQAIHPGINAISLPTLQSKSGSMNLDVSPGDSSGAPTLTFTVTIPTGNSIPSNLSQVVGTNELYAVQFGVSQPVTLTSVPSLNLHLPTPDIAPNVKLRYELFGDPGCTKALATFDVATDSSGNLTFVPTATAMTLNPGQTYTFILFASSLHQREALVVQSAANRVAAFDVTGSGTQEPLRTIFGSETRLSNPLAAAEKTDGTMYVLENYPDGLNSAVDLLVYAPGSTGNVKPVATIELGETPGVADGMSFDGRDTVYVHSSGYASEYQCVEGTVVNGDYTTTAAASPGCVYSPVSGTNSMIGAGGVSGGGAGARVYAAYHASTGVDGSNYALTFAANTSLPNGIPISLGGWTSTGSLPVPNSAVVSPLSMAYDPHDGSFYLCCNAAGITIYDQSAYSNAAPSRTMNGVPASIIDFDETGTLYANTGAGINIYNAGNISATPTRAITFAHDFTVDGAASGLAVIRQ